MEKNNGLKTLELRRTCDKFIVLNDQIVFYHDYNGRLSKKIAVNELLSNEKFYQDTLSSGYNELFKLNEGKLSDWEYIPLIRERLIEYTQNKSDEYWGFGKDICVYKKIDQSEVQQFYQLTINFEVRGVHVRGVYDISFKYPNCFRVFGSITRDEEWEKVLGERVRDEQDSRDFVYYLPISDIDKIIGVQEMYDISTFGTKVEQPTGEVVEHVLDLYNMDDRVLQFFREHNAVSLSFE